MSSSAEHREMNGILLIYDIPLVLNRPAEERLFNDVTAA